MDYGKQFGNAAVTEGADSYDYGWKLVSNGSPFDASNEAAGNSNGVGRNRLGSNYGSASNQAKLEGTLVHFQGDNIRNNDGTPGWGNEPRSNELFWELEIPNGIYEVTIGLGDKSASQFDSRHSATVEGYTIIPAFVPTSTETKVATMVVQVTDGLLTVNGDGGYNSKITHIDVVESKGIPVSGALTFNPDITSQNLAQGENGIFSSVLSGGGATDIGLVIDDNINTTDKTATGTNDWLTLPTTNVAGTYDFSMDTAVLADGDTRANTIIATAKGFIPTSLLADLTVETSPLVTITAPYRMNVNGSDYTRDGDLYVAETLGYLVETAPTLIGDSAIMPYNVPGGHSELYFPRRFGPEFSYDFPIANGNYTIALHMVENFQTAAGARIFDVSIESNTVIDWSQKIV